jgi:hypothetical protein
MESSSFRTHRPGRFIAPESAIHETFWIPFRGMTKNSGLQGIMGTFWFFDIVRVECLGKRGDGRWQFYIHGVRLIALVR